MTSHIRIPDVPPVAQAMADGAKSVFSFPFPIFTAGDLEVRANSTLVTTGYAVVGEGSSTGGAVIFTNAPANGVRITLRRRQTYARTDDFLDERAPTPHELNDAVDQNVAALQELAEQVSRSVQRPLAADLSQPLDLSLPVPEAGKVIGWNPLANGLVNLNTQTDIPVGKVQVDAADTPAYLESKLEAGSNITVTNNAAGKMTIAVTGLGTAATKNVGTGAADVAAGNHNHAGIYEPVDATILRSAAIGNTVQAYDAELAWVATNLTTAGQALLDDADAAAQRATLGLATVASSGAYNDLSGKPVLAPVATSGAYADLTGKPALGTAAYENIGTSGATVPLLNTANTYGAPQTPAVQVLTDAATVNIAITAQVWTLSTSAIRAIGAPTGGVANTFYFLKIVTNGFTPSWDSAFDFGAAGLPTSLSGTCGFDIFYDGAKYRISTRFTGGA